MNNVVKIEGGKARLTNTELHRRATKAIYEANHIVFENMPSLISQIIENKVWESFEHENFASYVLDATSNGLGVNTNQRLWLLRCGMRVHEEHIKEWTEILVKVEEMVRLEASKDGLRIESLDGNSLETIGQNPTHGSGKITYLPSKNKKFDGQILRLRKNNPQIYTKVVSREMTMLDARKSAGMKVSHDTNLGRAKSAFGKMTDEERDQFIEWLAEKLTPEERQALKELPS